MSVPGEFNGSVALQLVQSRAWEFEVSDDRNIRMNNCPFCGPHSHPAFVMEIHGTESETRGRDGLYNCHRCGKTGNIITLKQHLGIAAPQMRGGSFQEAGGDKEVEPLPDIEQAHEMLLADEDAMDYLQNIRGFSMGIIQRQKLGLSPDRYFRGTGKVRALIYPYLVNGNCVFVHYRTLPTMPLETNKVPKEFNSPKGWDAPLYNGGILIPGVKELVFVEGEANTIAALDKGFDNICGVPGANFKKAEWIDTLDKLELDKLYICYDKDKAGQKAAQSLASRIGVERCWKITLPDFAFIDPENGEEKRGKDLNEWFAFGGGTLEQFNKLKEDALLFDVEGVSCELDALQELEDVINDRGVEAKYQTKWENFNKLVKFDEGDVIDIVAEEKIGKTTFGLNIMEDMVNAYGEDGVIICLEMERYKLARKWVAKTAQIADNIPKTPEQAEKLKQLFLTAIPKVRAMVNNRSGRLYFCYPLYRTTDDIYKLIRDCIRRYGVKWIMLDNLQRLCDTTITGNKNRTQHLSEISKETSRLAKDYSVQILRIVQPHRIGEGKIATSRNADGASQIAKDCDASIALHRNRIGELTRSDFETLPYVEQESAFDSKMLVTVDLSRYSSGGYTTLDYDGAMSTVREMSMAQVARITAEASANVGYSGQLESLGVKSKDEPKALAGAITL